jgi:hypothetical protein
MVPYRSNDEGLLFGSMVPTERFEPLRCLRTLSTGRKRSSSSRGSHQQNRTNLDFACSLVSNTLCTDNNMQHKTRKNRFLLPCLNANRTLLYSFNRENCLQPPYVTSSLKLICATTIDERTSAAHMVLRLPCPPRSDIAENWLEAKCNPGVFTLQDLVVLASISV